jgi:hypothetical protein
MREQCVVENNGHFKEMASAVLVLKPRRIDTLIDELEERKAALCPERGAA